MYEALYRKYRPKTFDDVAGQEHITGTLKNQIRTGRLSHAYLFIGTRGTGKTTCARIMAKAVNCEHPVDGNPCNRCPSCLGIEDGSIMDVVELDAASNNGVDDVRMLRDEAIFSPTTLKKRVYIIDEVHMLSKSAFNALLKILEEPPEHLMFILATTELNKVLPTILSRCQRHSFKRLTGEIVAQRLMQVANWEGIRLEADAAALLGRLADGAMRDGLSLLDQCSGCELVNTEAVLNAMGLTGAYRTRQLCQCIAEQDVQSALAQFTQLWQDGKDPASLLGELSGLLRDMLLLRLAPKGGSELLSGAYSEDILTGLPMENGALLWALNVVQKYQTGMRTSQNPRLQCELCLIELCGTMNAATLSAPVVTAAPAKPTPTPVVGRASIEVVSAKPAPAPQPKVESKPEPKKEEVDDLPWDLPPLPGDEDAPPVAAEYIPPMPEPIREEPKPIAPPPPVPAPAAPVSSNESCSGWKEILPMLKGTVPMGTLIALEDEYQATGELNGNELVIKAATNFLLNNLNAPERLEKIRERVSEAMGQPMIVRVEEWKKETVLQEDKLGMLSQFGNVTFK